MDENEWPNISDSIAGLRAALECGFGLQNSIGDLRMYLSQLGGALRRDGQARKPMEALTEHGLAAGVMRSLRDALRAAEPETREAACMAFDYLEDREALAELRPLLQDPEAMVFLRAADALQRFGEPSAELLPRLTEILSRPEEQFPKGPDRIGGWPCQYLQMPESRYHAARILGYMGPEAAPARNELRAALESVSGTVRAEAAKALANIGEPPGVYLPPLRQALHDVKLQSSRERVWAAEGLVALGEPPESVVPVLIELVRDEDYAASIWAIELLRKLGPAAKSAIPLLREAKSSANEGVAEAATRALQSIEVPEGK